MDLAEFLMARIDDSERLRWLTADLSAALREVVKLHSEGTFEEGGDHLCYDSMTSADECATLQLLGAAWKHHPDYRHEWDWDHYNGVCVEHDET